MVKIVELDDTETVGLVSAGIGLAGSELPNKRRKKKTQSMDPLGGLRGMGGGSRVGGEHAEETNDAETKRAEPPSEEAASSDANEEHETHRSMDQTKPPLKTASPTQAMALLLLLLAVWVSAFVFVFTQSRSGKILMEETYDDAQVKAEL